MASIFDALINPTPEQNNGLLGFASGLLQASGPSRTPTSFGQALAGGIQGLQGAQDREQQREMAKLQAQLLGYKVEDAKSDIANQEATRKRAEALRQFYIERGAGGAAQSPAEMLGGQAAPTAANADRMAGMQAPQQTPGGGGVAGTGIFQQRLAEAQALRARGFGQEADAAEAAALKFQPKVKGWEKVRQDGKVLYAPFFEDGTSGQPVPLEVAEKLEKINRGGTTDLVNPYTGTQVQSMTNTQSPDSAASVAATLRGQNMTDSRAREFNGLKYEELGIKRQEKAREADLGKSGQIASFDTMLGTLNRLKDHPGLSRSTGLYSATPTIPGSDSANFQSELETFKSQAFIQAVAQLKGMGALSDAEGKKLSAAVGALDPKMSEKAFKASLDRVITEMNAARNRVVASASPEVRQSLGAPPVAPQQPAAPRAPMKGQVVQGYRFKGGNPADPSAWEKQ